MNAHSVVIGVTRETHAGERRVALVPADVKRLTRRAAVFVEHDAGARAGFTDRDYVAVGARVRSAQSVINVADILVKVRAPESGDTLRRQTVLVSLGGRDTALSEKFTASGLTHLGLERLPRTARAQSMDVLSSQAAIAGYAAVLEGARQLDILLPMMTTAAGTIKPAKMLAIGAGVAGLQALATARRLGAQVYGFDVRESAREQVESLGARFVSLETASVPSGEAAGGYALEQSEEEQERVRTALAKHISLMQLVVTSAQIPGRPAPKLINEATLSAMQPGSVIVDLAAESGGNTSLTRPDEIISVSGVWILGPTNLPSQFAADASRLFSGNIRALLEYIVDERGQVSLDAADPIMSALSAGNLHTRASSLELAEALP